ncbi:DUF2180 family protein [Streptomyces sp. HNM0663]|uniref:DUF2180 family protein n=1 Tax=Streptomyces chengmaiensis TaxID=3040919 RepID=A0ABT6HUX1_9ACTN|nr:DUF2180 family protein [Streptomyces chengmaiensis]MDH2392502.1 DUF2180 family protein [Streptomyces chengmaiensis]
MNCYECRRVSGTTNPAEAVCSQCGAGLCSAHVRIEKREVHQPHGLGKSSADLPGRRIVCPVCERAEHSE